MADVMGRIHSVETFGALDGPGIRYVLFLQGCFLRCAYCHNPDTWSREEGKMITASEAVEDILKYKSFIENGGVTLSGGEPLLQPEFCLEIIRRCHEQGICSAVDTAGGAEFERSCEVLLESDLILLDIKALEETVCRELTGKSNQTSLRILRYCQENQKDIWIRHVLVPGFTLNREKLLSLAEFLKGFSCIKRIELLPYHKMGEYKWEHMGLTCFLKETKEPCEEDVMKAKAIFKNRGFFVV